MTERVSRNTLRLAAGFLIAGMASVFAAPASANDETILASCKKDLGLSDSGCACVLDKVHSTLSEEQYAFFVATIKGDMAGQQAAQMKLTGEDVTDLANFMTTTPQACQNQ